jgi:hypothetical protein
MHTTYHTVPIDELPLWAERIKSTFHGKTLYFAISDTPFPAEDSEEEREDLADRDGLDETEYLMRSPANKRHLLQALENVKNRKNLITIENFDDLKDPEKLHQMHQRYLESQQEKS